MEWNRTWNSNKRLNCSWSWSWSWRRREPSNVGASASSVALQWRTNCHRRGARALRRRTKSRSPAQAPRRAPGKGHRACPPSYCRRSTREEKSSSRPSRRPRRASWVASALAHAKSPGRKAAGRRTIAPSAAWSCTKKAGRSGAMRLRRRCGPSVRRSASSAPRIGYPGCAGCPPAAADAQQGERWSVSHAAAQPVPRGQSVRSVSRHQKSGRMRWVAANVDSATRLEVSPGGLRRENRYRPLVPASRATVRGAETVAHSSLT
mmetsp:Transcript_24207/g.60603  ORF Transcript_24207/g.60603 Transcript_24207/m.60603 type:complete len:263 (+) Transcript_24207:772-1560(+)